MLTPPCLSGAIWGKGEPQRDGIRQVARGLCLHAQLARRRRSTALQARDHCKQAPDAGMVSFREARCWGLWVEWPGQAHQSCQIDQYQPTGTRVSGPRALRPRLCCPAWTWRGETSSAAPEHWRPRCPSEAASCVWCALTFVIAVRRPQRRVPDRRNGTGGGKNGDGEVCAN